jgi:hypothetical protein
MGRELAGEKRLRNSISSSLGTGKDWSSPATADPWDIRPDIVHSHAREKGVQIHFLGIPMEFKNPF